MFDPKIHLLAIATAQGVSLPGPRRIPGWLNYEWPPLNRDRLTHIT